MAIEVERDDSVVQDAVSAEEAEGLLERVLEKPSVKVDLASLRPLHSAVPGVESCAPPRRRNCPRDAELRAWLESALKPAPSVPGGGLGERFPV